MPTPTAYQVDKLRRFIGEGNLYTEVKKPADFTPLAFVTASPGVPQKTGLTTAATWAGLTSGAATVEYKPDFKGIEIEQANGEVAPRLTKETVTMKVTMAESDYLRLQLALQTATLTTTTGATTTPTTRLLSVGGKTLFTGQCVALVSPIGEYVDGVTTVPMFEWVCLYEALSINGVKLDYKRNENRMVDVTFTGYADVTRASGDQLFQIGEDEDPTP